MAKIIDCDRIPDYTLYGGERRAYIDEGAM
jgi:hypothetical protein